MDSGAKSSGRLEGRKKLSLDLSPTVLVEMLLRLGLRQR